MNVHLIAIGAVVLLVAPPAVGSAQSRVGSAPSPTSEPAASSADAYFRFVLGRHFESEGDIDRAIEAYRAAARLDPASAEIRAELAALYARQGRLEDAMTEARAALAIDKGSPEAHRVLGTLLASVVEETAPADRRSKQLAAAIAHLEQARRPDSVDPEPSVGLTLGRLYLRTDEPAKAIAVLRRLVEEHPILETWLLLGQAYSAAGQPEQAVRALEEGSGFDPRLLVALAEAYERQEKWTEAVATYERAASLGAPTADLKARWAGALLNTPGDENATRARELLQGLVAEEPSDDRAFYMLSQVHRRLRSFDAAEAAARRVIALQPDSLWGPYALAQVFESRRDYARVVETLGPVLSKWVPSRAAPARHGLTLLTHLGFAQLQLGQNDNAIATFDRARALAEGDSVYDIYLAQALVAARRFDDALRVMAPIREKQAGDFRVSQLVVRALSGAGRSDEAVALLQKAVAAAPSEPAAYLALADLLSEGKRESEAHRVIDDALKRFPKDPTVHFQRGALYERAGEMNHAEAAFKEVLALDPNHAPTLNYLGYMFAERGVRLDEALSLIERALTIDPDNGAYLDSLGWAYYQLKRFDRARDHLARAAEQLPGNSVVQDHFGDALAALGRQEEAIAAWTRALQGDRESIEVAAIEGKIRRARSSQAER
jgi:tetratricopeptide (TPR) repeat protein